MRTIGAMNEVASWLGLTGVRRMEAFDISNIYRAYESVGSMVVYEDGKPKRSDYRKFRIKTVIGPNDYALHAGGADAPLYPRAWRNCPS
ncbi:MAG: hypothetical protein ACLUD2_04935 [Clostridium sp.]